MPVLTATAPFTSAMPFRILNKGPEYFRRPPASVSRKLSAVERLEADKAKYVKSQQVATTKQNPVRPLVLKQPLFTPGVRRAMFAPNRKVPQAGRRGEGGGAKSSLNLEILNNLINFCDSPLAFPKPEQSPSDSPWLPKVHGRNLDTSSKPSSTVAVRRVDVRPCGVSMARSPPAIQLSLLPVPPTLLHRSKSDLSDRYSRATADLERFFNYCGLDPEDVGDMEMERFTRASSDIVSVKFHSVSTSSSAGTPSQRSTITVEDRQAERMPYGISIVERNARVIKWLYGLRQAKEAQKISNV
uniref:Family with sequence similarity 110 member A n=1 Tax=Pseudonaja textilis TaxID=8673 RepID=A0A670Z9P5_PSETE